MADTVARMTIADFLAWEARQEGRHEFVRGRIVAMVGGTRRHNWVGLNVVAHLKTALKGKKCRPYGADMKILIPNGNSRYADAVVDCGAMNDQDVAASEPTAFQEHEVRRPDREARRLPIHPLDASYCTPVAGAHWRRALDTRR